MVHPQASITGLICFQTLQQWEVVDLMVYPHASIAGIIHNHQFNLKERNSKMILQVTRSLLDLGEGDMH